VFPLVRDFCDIGEEFSNERDPKRIAGQQGNGRNFSGRDADMKLSLSNADSAFVDEAFLVRIRHP
jgi:hypothetical protein